MRFAAAAAAVVSSIIAYDLSRLARGFFGDAL
jgi:hypothetical protein